MATNLVEARCSQFQCRVSSVLNRNAKEFGKKFMFDGKEDTCWNSEQGESQWVAISFESEQAVKEVQIMFQGGFAGKDCRLEVFKNSTDESAPSSRLPFYPEDTNKLQRFEFPSCPGGRAFRLVFDGSTDFFGRVTIYQLNLISPA